MYFGSCVFNSLDQRASCPRFVRSELVDFIWQARPDLKQPLRLSWTETEMENGVRSNQHCCHDYVQFTPTCNQATGRAAAKPMWQWQVDWTWRGGQEAWEGGWRGCLAQCSLVLSSLSHSPTSALCAWISCCTENQRQQRLPWTKTLAPILFCPCSKRQCINIISYRDKHGAGKRFDLIPLKNIFYLAQGWKKHRRSTRARDKTLYRNLNVRLEFNSFVRSVTFTKPSNV